MTDTPANTEAAVTQGLRPTPADVVADPSMAPMDDDAGGPTADKEQIDEPGEEDVAAKLGDFA